MPLDGLLSGAERIAVFRALHLGDLLCSVPALRALRRSAPRARIALIGLPWSSAFVDRFSGYVDELIEFPGYPGLPERPFFPGALPPFLAQMQARQFDLALQMQGNGLLSNGFVTSLGAARSAGFYLPGTWQPDDTYIPYPIDRPEVDRHLALIGHLGGDVTDRRLEFPVLEADRVEVEELGALPARRPYAVVHPGARDVRRRWPPECFATAADALSRRGLTVLLTGTAEEAPVTAAVRAAMNEPSRDLAGRLSLGGLAALLDRATLLVSNDTGVSHLADALGTPSVVVFAASDPARWAPLDAVRHRALGGPLERPGDAHCCLGEICSHAVEAWRPVAPDEVIGAALPLLGGGASHAA